MGNFISSLFIDPNPFQEGLATCVNTTTARLLHGHQCAVAEGRLTDDGYGFIQLLFLMAVYAYMLFIAAGLIGDGSELLMLVPSLKGVVGTLVLPILGAVPDGAIVLFSGMGPQAQAQLSVGVGALAGSTIMLLTLTWGISIMAGAVDIDAGTGQCQYKKKKGGKLTNNGYGNTGVQPDSSLRASANIMVITSISYLVIQAPAFRDRKTAADALSPGEIHGEKTYAFVGFLCTVVMFVGNLIYQLMGGADENVLDSKVAKLQAEQIGSKLVTFRAAFASEIDELRTMRAGATASTRNLSAEAARKSEAEQITTGLLGSEVAGEIQAAKGKIGTFINNKVWRKVDVNNDGQVDMEELRAMFELLGEPISKEQAMLLRDHYDADKNGLMSKPEFTELFTDWVLGSTPKEAMALSKVGTSDEAKRDSIYDGEAEGGDAEEEEEEDEEIPEDLLSLSVEQQQKAIKWRSLKMMSTGLVLVLLFSDPMVDCLSAFGARIGVPAFYVSFVLAPLASNASELLAGYRYSLKKTTASITVAQSQLLGAGIMNNTFCLLVFMMLVWLQPIQWAFAAETITILVVELIVAAFAYKKVQTRFHALLIFGLYPLSLLLVVFLEQGLGWD